MAQDVLTAQDLDPSTIPWTAGGVQQALQQLRGLKSQLTAGQINSADYMQQAQPFIDVSQNIVQTIAGQGSKAASSINPIWQQMQNENFVKADSGKWVAGLPLSAQEYAALPDSAKPTAEQMESGLVPPNSLPGNMGLNEMIKLQQKQQQDLGNKAVQGIQNQYQQFLPEAQDALMQNIMSGPMGQQMRGQLNNLGILNGGAFSEGVGNALQSNQQNILGQENSDIMGTLNNIYGTNSQLGVGGLQRQFSLQDFYNNADLQRQLMDMQNNAYMSALNQSQMNPWAQMGMGFVGGFGQGLGMGVGKK